MKGFSFCSHLKILDFKTENLDKSELYFIEENILVIVLRKFSQRGINLTTLENEDNFHLRVGKSRGEENPTRISFCSNHRRFGVLMYWAWKQGLVHSGHVLYPGASPPLAEDFSRK